MRKEIIAYTGGLVDLKQVSLVENRNFILKLKKIWKALLILKFGIRTKKHRITIGGYLAFQNIYTNSIGGVSYVKFNHSKIFIEQL